MTIKEVQEIRKRNDAWRCGSDGYGITVLANSVLHIADMGGDLLKQIKEYNFFNDDNPDDLHDIGFIRAPNGTVVVFWLEPLEPNKWVDRMANFGVTPTHILTIAPLKCAAEVTNNDD